MQKKVWGSPLFNTQQYTAHNLYADGVCVSQHRISVSKEKKEYLEFWQSRIDFRKNPSQAANEEGRPNGYTSTIAGIVTP